jgi:Pyruvate/2-oxoacid:ferredoxin oxidoreductase delta subunit
MTKRFPTPDYHFSYRIPPVSGNTINGLGETSPRRARQVFHGSGARKLEWVALEMFFGLTMPLHIFIRNALNRWELRKADGPLARKRTPVPDSAEMSKQIKSIAKQAGAGAVGITPMTEDALFEGQTADYQTAIVIALPQDYETMKAVTTVKAAAETVDTYRDVSRIVMALAAHIRSLGWRARAYGESADLLHIPLAINAGIGQLGKHGSVIGTEFGSNFRLASVLTDIPLAIDSAVDIGVDDLCLGCQRCTIDCPADAISDQRQWVRGKKKWYVDFDRCVMYFVKTLGCGICIEVCPWSRPGRGPSLSQTLLAKRAKRDPT